MNYIIAYTGGHALAYARKRGWGPKDWRYVAQVSNLKGIHNASIYYVGNWWSRSDSYEIEKEVESRLQHRNAVIHDEGGGI